MVHCQAALACNLPRLNRPSSAVRLSATPSCLAPICFTLLPSVTAIHNNSHVALSTSPPPPQVASLCADNVVNTNVPCCGMAGDRGMRYPELTAASLQVCVRAAMSVCLWAGPVGLCSRCLLHSFMSRSVVVSHSNESKLKSALCTLHTAPCHCHSVCSLAFVRFVLPAAPERGRLLRRVLHKPHLRDEPEQPQRHQLPGAGVPG